MTGGVHTVRGEGMEALAHLIRLLMEHGVTFTVDVRDSGEWALECLGY